MARAANKGGRKAGKQAEPAGERTKAPTPPTPEKKN